VAVVGPTAVGKTAVAVELVSMVGGEIVSADSMAVYKEMDIGTAKPTAEERKRARFHLIDVVDPGEAFSVGDFQRLAHETIDRVIDTSPPAVVVGGSGLYVRAAIDGLDMSMPGEDPEFRESLREEARRLGNESVFERLARVDPVSAERIHANNLKRVIRALEIYHLTGTPASERFDADASRPPRYADARFFGLVLKRDALYRRIEQRVDAMIAAGLVDEVRRLAEREIDPMLPSMQGLGYREMLGHLRGDYGFDEAVELLKKNTRRFAKRQYTWFGADSRIEWIDVQAMTAREVSKTIKERLSDEQRTG